MSFHTLCHILEMVEIGLFGLEVDFHKFDLQFEFEFLHRSCSSAQTNELYIFLKEFSTVVEYKIAIIEV